ncbi:M1 family aminopeptidase [Neokomagataea anthophila]|uniref:Aminopeptidase N n=1 Tax=Neokomagataea anthophila TaxID=2826925 RepID=A0ABS5E5E2_9PROT|nr:M1 family aminopeptidase [Neokomagataea anthophila]MBR0559121.1 hypothetical protein [Neokomagataea anthophila]
MIFYFAWCFYPDFKNHLHRRPASRRCLSILTAIISFNGLISANHIFAKTTPNTNFDVTSYTLTLTPDIQNETVSGHETILLHAVSNALQRLDFTRNALTIESALLDGIPLSSTQTGDNLTFNLPTPIPRGHTVKLELIYHGHPARGLARSATALYTSYFACDWMVCRQDAFGDKADFSLKLRVSSGMNTLSVGRLLSKQIEPDGSEVHLWKSPRPYSAYLYGFAIGHFASVTNQVGLTKLTYLSDIAEAEELKRRLASTNEMVHFLSEKAGIPLPVAEYSQLLVKGDEAQEAATYSVIGMDELPTTNNDPAQDWVIIHELTHQWWGNLITCATLQDFWLNEGITTFITAVWKEHLYGQAAYNAELNLARQRLEKARNKGFDKPLAWNGDYPTLGIRRAVQYSKGALFMDYLRTTLGDTAFWSGIRRYTRAHAGGTVTSIDFEKDMETASGRDLHQIFNDWVFGVASQSTTPSSQPKNIISPR